MKHLFTSLQLLVLGAGLLFMQGCDSSTKNGGGIAVGNPEIEMQKFALDGYLTGSYPKDLEFTKFSDTHIRIDNSNKIDQAEGSIHLKSGVSASNSRLSGSSDDDNFIPVSFIEFKVLQKKNDRSRFDPKDRSALEDFILAENSALSLSDFSQNQLGDGGISYIYYNESSSKDSVEAIQYTQLPSYAVVRTTMRAYSVGAGLQLVKPIFTSVGYDMGGPAVTALEVKARVHPESGLQILEAGKKIDIRISVPAEESGVDPHMTLSFKMTRPAGAEAHQMPQEFENLSEYEREEMFFAEEFMYGIRAPFFSVVADVERSSSKVKNVHFKVPPHVAPGVYKLDSFYLEDSLGNIKFYNARESGRYETNVTSVEAIEGEKSAYLENTEFVDSGIPVQEFAVINSGVADTVHPILHSFEHLSTIKGGPRGMIQVKFKVNFEELGTGLDFDRTDLRFRAMNRPSLGGENAAAFWGVESTSVSDITDNSFVFTVNLWPEVSAGDYFIETLSIQDKAGNLSQFALDYRTAEDLIQYGETNRSLNYRREEAYIAESSDGRLRLMAHEASDVDGIPQHKITGIQAAMISLSTEEHGVKKDETPPALDGARGFGLRIGESLSTSRSEAQKFKLDEDKFFIFEFSIKGDSSGTFGGAMFTFKREVHSSGEQSHFVGGGINPELPPALIESLDKELYPLLKLVNTNEDTGVRTYQAIVPIPSSSEIEPGDYVLSEIFLQDFAGNAKTYKANVAGERNRRWSDEDASTRLNLFPETDAFYQRSHWRVLRFSLEL